MNIYDVLRKLVEARPWQDSERADALKLIGDLEQMQVFGYIAGSTTEQDHICEAAGEWFPESVRCLHCGKPMDPPLHACVPKQFTGSGGWGGFSNISSTKCAICGRKMD